MNVAASKQDQVWLIVNQPTLIGDEWKSYEAGKAQLNVLDLSSEDYESAVKRLAETLGI